MFKKWALSVMGILAILLVVNLSAGSGVEVQAAYQEDRNYCFRSG